MALKVNREEREVGGGEGLGLTPDQMLKDARPVAHVVLPEKDQVQIAALDAEAGDLQAAFEAAKKARQGAAEDLRALEKKAQKTVMNPTLTVSGLHAGEQDEALQNQCRRWTPIAEQAVYDAEELVGAARNRLMINRSQRAQLMADALGRHEAARMARAAEEKAERMKAARAEQVKALKAFLATK